MNEKRLKILNDYKKKKDILEKYMKSAPFTRFTDKLIFIFGVLQVIIQSFILGRYPHDLYYKYHSIVLPLKIIFKWANYKKLGWHYWMTDFCYFANTITLIFLNVYPKSEALFMTSYFYAFGPLLVAVGAFRNQMVFHLIDNMSSLALHVFPPLALYNLRWVTMEH